MLRSVCSPRGVTDSCLTPVTSRSTAQSSQVTDGWFPAGWQGNSLYFSDPGDQQFSRQLVESNRAVKRINRRYGGVSVWVVAWRRPDENVT